MHLFVAVYFSPGVARTWVLLVKLKLIVGMWNCHEYMEGWMVMKDLFHL